MNNPNKYNPKIQHRRSIRLKGYDYSQAGLYFVTICVQHRECVFGEVAHDTMILNEYGKMAEKEWIKTAQIRTNVELGEFIIMPNHFHAIVAITDTVGALRATPLQQSATPLQQSATPLQQPATPLQQSATSQQKNEYMASISPKSGTLSAIIRAYKSALSKNIHKMLPNFEWQRNYYENIIRNDKSLKIISEYIINNPANWNIDKFFAPNIIQLQALP
jgi:REP element-mobilizing transposase RayT